MFIIIWWVFLYILLCYIYLIFLFLVWFILACLHVLFYLFFTFGCGHMDIISFLRYFIIIWVIGKTNITKSVVIVFRVLYLLIFMIFFVIWLILITLFFSIAVLAKQGNILCRFILLLIKLKSRIVHTTVIFKIFLSY